MSNPDDPNKPSADLPPGVQDDESIPTLTEILQAPALADTPVPASLSDADLDALAQRLRDNLTAGIGRQADAIFGAQLRATLRVMLERSAEQMANDLYTALSQQTRDLVARAVADEIARLRQELTKRQDRPDSSPDS
ncbi:MAG: hypothetical protein ACO3BH_02960 [Quisquiliibacterium sp.]